LIKWCQNGKGITISIFPIQIVFLPRFTCLHVIWSHLHMKTPTIKVEVENEWMIINHCNEYLYVQHYKGLDNHLACEEELDD
jgi:hypothetical protein